MGNCIQEGCNRKIHAKDYCAKHYSQIRRHGKTFSITQYDFNEIVDKGSYCELVLTDKSMNEIGRAKIDKEDLPKVKAIGRWSLMKKGYVTNTKGDTTTLMHRVIMNAKNNEDVDHIK